MGKKEFGRVPQASNKWAKYCQGGDFEIQAAEVGGAKGAVLAPKSANPLAEKWGSKYKVLSCLRIGEEKKK